MSATVPTDRAVPIFDVQRINQAVAQGSLSAKPQRGCRLRRRFIILKPTQRITPFSVTIGSNAWFPGMDVKIGRVVSHLFLVAFLVCIFREATTIRRVAFVRAPEVVTKLSKQDRYKQGVVFFGCARSFEGDYMVAPSMSA